MRFMLRLRVLAGESEWSQDAWREGVRLYALWLTRDRGVQCREGNILAFSPCGT